LDDQQTVGGESGGDAWPRVPARSFKRIHQAIEALGLDYTLTQRAVVLDTGKNHTGLSARMRDGGRFKTVEFIYRDGRFHHATVFIGPMHLMRQGPPETVDKVRTLRAALSAVDEGVM